MNGFIHNGRGRRVGRGIYRLGNFARSGLILTCLLFDNYFSGPTHGQAAEEQPLEYQVKAAFLLNFTKFVEWPQTAFMDERSPLAICILGGDPFAGAIDQIVEGEAVNGRKLIVSEMKESPSPKACQVLFIGKAVPDISKTLSSLGPDILTVGEGGAFLRNGGVIAFVIEKARVRFDINQTAAEKAGLKLSSRLLRVARSVER